MILKQGSKKATLQENLPIVTNILKRISCKTARSFNLDEFKTAWARKEFVLKILWFLPNQIFKRTALEALKQRSLDSIGKDLELRS